MGPNLIKLSNENHFQWSGFKTFVFNGIYNVTLFKFFRDNFILDF